MKLKQYLLITAGVIVGGAVSIAGVSYATFSNTDNNLKLITSEKAKSIMLAKVPGATILEFSYESDDKIPKYDGTLIKDEFEYEVDVNAKNGDVIKFEKEKITISSNDGNVKPSTDNTTKPSTDNTTKPSTDNTTKPNNSSFIGEAKAKSIMLEKVPGAKITSFYLENDNTPEYEGKLVSGNFEYEISVNAKTGSINEFSKETIDKYDNDDKYDDDKYDDDKYDNDDKYDDDKYDNDDKYDDDKYDNDDKYDDGDDD